MAYSFTPINDPKAGTGLTDGTDPVSVDDQGQIQGYYFDGNGTEHGFLFANGSFTDASIPPDPTLPGVNVTVPVAYSVSYVTSSNSSGELAGDYLDSNGTFHGFVDNHGAFTLIDAPGARKGTGTHITGINDAGEIVGYFFDGTHTEGFSATPPATAAASTIAGSPGLQFTSDESSLTPFQGIPQLGLNFVSGGETYVTVADPNLGATDFVVILVTDSLGNPTEANGKLFGAGLTESSTEPGAYTLAAADPTTVSNELAALQFVPTPHQEAPGSVVTTQFVIWDVNSADPTETAVNDSTSIQAIALDDAPLISGTRAGQQVSNNASINPFAQVNVIELDHGVQDSAIITLGGAGGTLTGMGLSATGTPGRYSLAAATSATLTAELDALTFTPTAAVLGAPATTTFSLTVSQTGAGTLSATDSTATVTNTIVSQPSTITGTKASQAATDEVLVKPFAGVTIRDLNPGATDYALIALGNGAGSGSGDGTLSGVGLTAATGFFAGEYTLAATDAATLTKELNALVFIPAAHQVAPGQQVTTSFTITDYNSAGGITTDSTTSVVATAVNDPPTITGTKANQATTNYATVKPFAGVTISDPDAGAQDSLTIAVFAQAPGQTAPAGGGALSGAGLSRTATQGIYTLAAASPATLSAELDALTFTPANAVPGLSYTTTFYLTASQNAGGSTATGSDTTTTVINTVGAPQPSLITGTKAHQFTTDASTIKPFAAVAITDPNGPYAADGVVIQVKNGQGALTDADGILSGAGLTKTGTGAYTVPPALSSPSLVTAELDALVFTPSKVTGGPVTTTFTLYGFNSVDTSQAAVDSTTSVTVSSASGPPIAGGPPPTPPPPPVAVSAPTLLVPASDQNRTSTGLATVTPFAGAAISDPNAGSPTETVTITPSTLAVGRLADPNAATDGSTRDPGTGAITLTGSAGAVTTALNGLTFTPAYGQSGQTSFAIVDQSSLYPLPITATASLTVDLPPLTPALLATLGTDLGRAVADGFLHQSTAKDISTLTSDLTALDISQSELGQLVGQALSGARLVSDAANTLGADIAAHWYPKLTADVGQAGQGLTSDLGGLIATTAGAGLDDLLRSHLGQSPSAALAGALHDFRLG